MSRLVLHKNKGFTLVELVVVASIMSVIMLLVMFNSRRFNDDLSLQTAASEISLVMRQAQNFGVSIKESSPGSATFTSSYGIVFDLVNSKNFFIYSDLNNNFRYDGSNTCSGTDECREKNNLRGGVTLRRVCAVDAGNILTCFSGNARYLVLSYVRPNPEPVIKVYNSSNIEIGGSWKEALVELVNQNGTRIYVTTDLASGQIIIKSTPIIP